MRVPYGVGVVVDLPVVSQADTKLYKTSATIAAGDAKIRSDTLILTTLTSKTRTFTSGGTYVIQKGDTITGATSAATAVVIGVRLTSGTFAGGDAAGVLFVEQDSGTFQSENLDVGSNTNVATIGGALSSAGVFNEIDSGVVAIGIPSTQLQCRRAMLIVRDAAGAEWCDTGLDLEVEGNDALDTGTAVAIAAGTITLRANHGISTVGSVLITLLGGTDARGKSRLATYSGSVNVFNVDPAWNAGGESTPSGTIIYRVDPAPPSPTSTLPNVNVEQINNIQLTGDGDGTPMDAA
jgi:hypothetical protein